MVVDWQESKWYMCELGSNTRGKLNLDLENGVDEPLSITLLTELGDRNKGNAGKTTEEEQA
jgi:hypothetical protein